MTTTEQNAAYFTRAQQAIRGAISPRELKTALAILDEPGFEALPLHCQETLTIQGVQKDARFKFEVE